jgi:hypothetical protein
MSAIMDGIAPEELVIPQEAHSEICRCFTLAQKASNCEEYIKDLPEGRYCLASIVRVGRGFYDEIRGDGRICDVCRGGRISCIQVWKDVVRFRIVNAYGPGNAWLIAG